MENRFSLAEVIDKLKPNKLNFRYIYSRVNEAVPILFTVNMSWPEILLTHGFVERRDGAVHIASITKYKYNPIQSKHSVFTYKIDFRWYICGMLASNETNLPPRAQELPSVHAMLHDELFLCFQYTVAPHDRREEVTEYKL